MEHIGTNKIKLRVFRCFQFINVQPSCAFCTF